MKATALSFLSAILSMSLFAGHALAQTAVVKNPRVLELEEKFVQDIRHFFQNRFPQTPYSVEVSITPLRRDLGSGYEAKGDYLPYLEVSEVEYRDEWDDPGASLYDLTSRIQSSRIEVNVPKSMNQDEILEIRETLERSLRLLPGRDEVRVIRQAWSVGRDLEYYVAIGFGLFLVYLLCLFLIQRLSMRSLGKTLGKLAAEKDKDDGPVMAPPPMAPMTMNSPMAPDGRSGKSSLGDDVKFRDPVKTRELAHLKITNLLTEGSFPCLNDMILLQKYAQSDMAAMGGMVQEFPVDVQRRIFSLAPDETWLEAFAEPGEIETSGLHVIDRMARSRPERDSESWQTLLIQVWRMDEQSKLSFFSGLEKDQGYAILSAMPKSMAIPFGRRQYPGNWAILLDPQHRHAEISEKHVRELLQKSLELSPKLSKSIIHLYNEEKDLLHYLRKASSREERDIYEVMDNDRFVRLRPPFYRLFQESPSVIRQVFGAFRMEEWSMALFNVDRADRAKVEGFFGQKEKYLYMEMMKHHDRQQLNPLQSGAVREKIGKYLYDLKQRSQTVVEPAESPDSPDSEAGESEAA